MLNFIDFINNLKKQNVIILNDLELKELIDDNDNNLLGFPLKVYIVGLKIIRKNIKIFFADQTNIEIPKKWFAPNPSAKPNFSKPYITDYGLSVGFGEDYEVSSTSILRDFDPTTYKTIFN